MRAWNLMLLAATLAAPAYAQEAPAQEATAREAPAGPPLELSIANPADARVRAALRRKVTWEFRETPLQDVVDQLQDQLKVPVRLDVAALRDVGEAPELPVTLAVRGVSAQSALRLLLGPSVLSHTVRDGLLVITTEDVAERDLANRIYPVADLVVADGSLDFDSLIELLTSTVEPDSWADVGGPATIEAYSASLVVSQTEAGHRSVEDLLAALRKLSQRLDQGQTDRPGDVSPTVERLASRLERPASIHVDGSLAGAIKEIAATQQLPLVLDQRALDSLGIDPETPVKIKLQDLPLRVALREMLHNLGLTYLLRDEVVVVTTQEEAESQGVTRIYPVADLVKGPTSADSLLEVIRSTVAPDTWDEVGGYGTATGFRLRQQVTLVVSQTLEVHEQIERLLAQLRKAKAVEREQNPAVAEMPDPSNTLYRFVYRFRPAAEGVPAMTSEEVETVLLKLMPDVWRGEHLLIAVKGGLVVRTTTANHQQVSKLLMELGLLSNFGQRAPGGYF